MVVLARLYGAGRVPRSWDLRPARVGADSGRATVEPNEDMNVLLYCRVVVQRGSAAAVMASVWEEAAKHGQPWRYEGKHAAWDLFVLRPEQVAYFHPHPDGELP